MPAVHFNVLWPDGEQQQYYSPSTVVHEHFSEGQSYEIQDFSRRVFTALENASERVRMKYGYACSAASGEAKKIENKLNELNKKSINGEVTLINFS